MVEAVRRHGVILQTGSQHRSKETMRFACELVRNGRIGKVKRVLTSLGRHGLRFDLDTWQPTPVPEGFDYDLWLGPAPLAPHHPSRCFYTFRFVQDCSGGETTNTGAHKFDIVQWGLGTERTGPVEIEDLGSEFPKTGLFDTVSKIHFRARYASGVELICTPAGVGGAGRFEGTEGWVHTDGIAPVEVGHRSASVCHLANIAMKLGRKLRWDPDEEHFVGDDQANRLLSKPLRAPWHA